MKFHRILKCAKFGLCLVFVDLHPDIGLPLGCRPVCPLIFTDYIIDT